MVSKAIGERSFSYENSDYKRSDNCGEFEKIWRYGYNVLHADIFLEKLSSIHFRVCCFKCFGLVYLRVYIQYCRRILGLILRKIHSKGKRTYMFILITPFNSSCDYLLLGPRQLLVIDGSHVFWHFSFRLLQLQRDNDDAEHSSFRTNGSNYIWV